MSEKLSNEHFFEGIAYASQLIWMIQILVSRPLCSWWISQAMISYKKYFEQQVNFLSLLFESIDIKRFVDFC